MSDDDARLFQEAQDELLDNWDPDTFAEFDLGPGADPMPRMTDEEELDAIASSMQLNPPLRTPAVTPQHGESGEARGNGAASPFSMTGGASPGWNIGRSPSPGPSSSTSTTVAPAATVMAPSGPKKSRGKSMVLIRKLVAAQAPASSASTTRTVPGTAQKPGPTTRTLRPRKPNAPPQPRATTVIRRSVTRSATRATSPATEPSRATTPTRATPTTVRRRLRAEDGWEDSEKKELAKCARIYLRVRNIEEPRRKAAGLTTKKFAEFFKANTSSKRTIASISRMSTKLREAKDYKDEFECIEFNYRKHSPL